MRRHGKNTSHCNPNRIKDSRETTRLIPSFLPQNTSLSLNVLTFSSHCIPKARVNERRSTCSNTWNQKCNYNRARLLCTIRKHQLHIYPLKSQPTTLQPRHPSCSRTSSPPAPCRSSAPHLGRRD